MDPSLSCPMTTRRFIPTRSGRTPASSGASPGEHAAIAYLTSCGWSVEAHRFKLGRHDLDLIVRRGSIVAFVEVKTRRSTTFGLAAEAVGWRKQRTLSRVAELWRLRYGRPSDTYRFDLVCGYGRRKWPDGGRTPGRCLAFGTEEGMKCIKVTQNEPHFAYCFGTCSVVLLSVIE